MPAPSALRTDLPIEPLLPELRAALAASPSAVLQAPPGAGKTTRVPLALLDAAWLAGRRIVMLEPRRLAARAAARRMAEMIGEKVGETVGYRVRLDSAVSRATRVEVVTAGVFIRQIQDDPSLEGVGAVLFDEFHERSLDVDLGLALALDARQALRPELRLLAMSATLDGGPIAKILAPSDSMGAPILTSEGKRYPVETRHLAREPTTRLDETAANAIRRALDSDEGDVLVFLPGVGDIRRVEQRVLDFAPPSLDIVPLYSDLPLDRQDAALRPAPAGRRKVVLATSIAETSLTIEGVRVVIDSGFMRVPRFDPGTGMSRLETVRVSRAAADQRRGRAGRLGPGICHRLWSEAADRALIPYTAPEIADADLAPLALELASWGADADRLAWLDPPPEAALSQGRDLLQRLGALDDKGVITGEGRRMARLGMHPRLAHMLWRGKDLGLGGLAADLAALLGERDVLRGRERDADLRHRVDMLRSRSRAAQPVAQVAQHWRRALGVGKEEHADSEDTGLLVALAYPDRIAQRRVGTRGQFRLASGRGATLPESDPLAGNDFLAVATVDGAGANARIFLAAPLAEADIRRGFADQIHEIEFVTWDPREEAVTARRQRRLGDLVLDDAALGKARDTTPAMLEGVRALGLAALPWSREARSLQTRSVFLRRIDGDAWPDLSDAALLATLGDWLAPYLTGITRRAHLERLDLLGALRARLSWEQQKRLDQDAPTHVTVPTGSRIPIDYSGETPVLAVRLQEMFGLARTPAIAGGRVPLLLHLLSPAHRPMQVTRDLAGFWTGSYKDVRRDLRGQYPKHYWPEDPLQAAPTRRAKPRGT